MQNDAATIPNYVELTSDVVSAYVSNNSVSRTDLPGLIGTVHAALSGTSTPAQSNEKLTPPVPINKTIRPDYSISLEDGRRYKSMKRRPRVAHHLLQAWLTLPSCRASSSKPSLARMTFCSLVISVSSRTPRPGAAHPDHSAPGLGSRFSLMTPSVRSSVDYCISTHSARRAAPCRPSGRGFRSPRQTSRKPA